MIKTLNRTLSFLLTITLIASCGGGGGGGGGSGSGSNARFGVRILHGAVEATPVEFAKPRESEELVQVRFLGDTFYVDSPEGDLSIPLFTANSGGSDLLISPSFTVSSDTRYSILLFGDQTTLGLRSTILTDSFPEVSDELALVRVANGVVGASSVTISLTGRSDSFSLPFGGGGSYLEVPLGAVSFVVRRTADGLVLARGTIETEAAGVYTVLVGGEVGVFVSSRVYDDR